MPASSKPTEPHRSERVVVRLRPEDRATIEEAADKVGLDLATAMRMASLAWARTIA